MIFEHSISKKKFNIDTHTLPKVLFLSKINAKFETKLFFFIIFKSRSIFVYGGVNTENHPRDESLPWFLFKTKIIVKVLMYIN